MSPLASVIVRLRLLGSALALLAAFAAAPAPALAAPPENSLSLVPADAGLYMTMLRNKEQYDLVAESRWFARLQQMPAAQDAWEQMQASWNEEGGPGEKLAEFLKDEDNRELAELGVRLTYDEVFVYADDSLADVYDVYLDASWAGNFAMYGALASGDLFGADPTSLMMRGWLDVIDKQKDRLRVPKVIVGFKIREADLPIAARQMERLAAARELLGLVRPDLKERLHKVELDGSTFWTLELEGTDYDWDSLPALPIDDDGKYKAVIDKLKGLKAAVAVGVHKGYLLFSLGPTNEHLATLGKGMLLVNRPEFAPLPALGDRAPALTQVAFVSAKYHSQSSYFNADDLDANAARAKELVNKTPLDLADKRKIQADIDELAADLKKYSPRFGPALSFSLLTDRGYEGFAYDWTQYPNAPQNQRLDVLEHVGGAPLFVAAGPSPLSLESYETLVKWAGKFRGYFEQFGVAQMPPEEQEKYDTFMKKVQPLLERLDKTTREKWIPSLAGGQTAIVLDAVLKDKRWLDALPPADEELKLLQPAVVSTARDGEQVAAALDEYRKTVNEMLEAIRELSPDMGAAFSIPEPKVEAGEHGKLYVFSLPEELGLNDRLRPNYGVAKSVVVYSAAPEHSAALLKSTPPKLDSFKAPEQLVGLVHLDVAGLTDAVVPWISFGMQFGGEEVDMEQQQNLRVAVDLMQAFRSLDYAIWRNDDALIVHSQFRIQDLDK